MSDDVLGTARQILAELEASEAYLRTVAVTSLPWSNVIGAERRAGRRCSELLAALGTGFEFRPARAPALPSAALDDTTDELLTGAVQPRAVAAVADDLVRQTRPAGGLASPELVGGFAAVPGAYEPLDDGPEGAAEDRHDLSSESEEVDLPPIPPAPGPDDDLQEVKPEPLDDDDDTDETLDRTPAPAPSAPDPQPELDTTATDGLLPFDDPASSGSLVSFDDALAPNDEEPTLGQAPPVDDDPFASLVSFGDPAPPEAEEEQEEEGETIIAAYPTEPDETPVPGVRHATPSPVGRQSPASAPARATPSPSPSRFSDVGADALVTMDERSSDLLHESLAGEDDIELELDNDESFDLMPDVADDASQFEDEEVTVVRASATGKTGSAVLDARATPAKPIRPAPPRPTQPAKPVAPIGVAAGGAKVTAGLYGGSSVPTIRDSDDPKPRAAAIQLNSGGQGGKVLGLEEEEEPIEIGAAEDYDDADEMDLADGFSVTLQASGEPEFDDDDDEDDEEEDDEVIEQARGAEPPPGPTPEQIQELLDRAQSAAEAGDLQGGADLYSDALDLDPDSVSAHVARGRLYLDLGDYSRAMSDFMVSEDIAPEDPEPQVAIGDLYFARKDYRKAIDYFNAALQLAPNHAMAYCRRGISHYYRKNYSEALTDLLKAEKLDRDIPNIQTFVSMARKKVKK